VGLGQAVVADQLGSESIWWNPAALARLHSRELALHHGQTFALTQDAFSFVLPVAPVGVLAVSASLFNYGAQEQTDITGTLGTFTPRANIYAASFAASAGSRVFLGLNYKVYQLGISCSGGCAGFASQNAATSALDFGAQVIARADSTLVIGAALRNVGPRLQVNDAPQADPLPTRLDIGVTYAPRIASLGPDASLKFGAGVVNSIPSTGAGLRVGTELSWQQKIHVRAGYVHEGPGGSGPTIGVGASTGRLVLDIARLFSDNVANTSTPPTYLSLRFVF
jgi:hypothetical protein